MNGTVSVDSSHRITFLPNLAWLPDLINSSMVVSSVVILLHLQTRYYVFAIYVFPISDQRSLSPKPHWIIVIVDNYNYIRPVSTIQSFSRNEVHDYSPVFGCG